jgi:hypothetical protein
MYKPVCYKSPELVELVDTNYNSTDSNKPLLQIEKILGKRLETTGKIMREKRRNRVEYLIKLDLNGNGVMTLAINSFSSKLIKFDLNGKGVMTLAINSLSSKEKVCMMNFN